MSGPSTDLFADLTERQIEAAESLQGPLLVLAGPGSGKTTVVTRRVANLVFQGIPAWQILALTFTNKAAREMRDRIETLLPDDLPGRRGLTVCTFHSFCARVLRRYAGAAGIAPQFSIYDSADQRDAVKRALSEAELSTKNWPPASVASAISGAKNRLLDASAYEAQATDFYTRTIARIYRAYARILEANQALDFDDLLLQTARILRGSEPVRQELQQRYQYLLIDEYQDTNHAQFVIAQTLAASHGNICVVGDPDQSIYGWRGADIGNILEFEEHYPQARVIPLDRNFRSTGHIVAAAACLIAHNRRRKAKSLHTELEDGEKPVVTTCRDERHEAAMIADELRRRRDEHDIPWREMAVLYRINALSRVLEEAFRDAQIPYVIARGTAFYERKEVMDALAYLRVIANPRDEVALRRILNTPTRGIGATTVSRVELHAAEQQVSFLESLRRAGEIGSLSARAVGAIEKFLAMVDRWCAAAESPSIGLAEFVATVIRESGLEASHARAQTEEEQQRLENLNELINAAAEFVAPPPEPIGDPETETAMVPDPTLGAELRAYLESVALVSDADAIDPVSGAVTLMTLHTAKGLEFDVVAVAGLEEGLLPHSRAAADERELEEERRLCFVGMTRARRHLLMARAAVRTYRGLRERTIESQFLRELPEQAVIRSDHAGIDDDLESFLDPSIDADELGRPAGHGRRAARGGAPEASSGLTVGALVRHPTFGLGRVEALTPRPRGSSARIAFTATGVGTKTLILEYAKLERVE